MEVLGDQARPRLLQDGTGNLSAFLGVLSYQQLPEEELVGQAPNPRTAQAVDLIASTDQLKGPVKTVLDVRKDHLRCIKGLLGLLKLVSDPVVLVAGQVTRDSAGDDTTGEPLTLLGQLLDAALGPGDLRSSLPLLVVEFSAQAVTNLVLESFGEHDCGVVALNRSLDGCSRQVALRAEIAALVAADTEKVEVVALGLGEAKTAAAVGAVDGALEVVMMDALLLSRAVMGAQNILYAIKEGLRDEWLVATLVLGALERDVAQVVAVRQHCCDVRALYRT